MCDSCREACCEKCNFALVVRKKERRYSGIDYVGSGKIETVTVR